MKMTFCVALQLFAIAPSVLYASDAPNPKSKNCDTTWKLVKKDWNNDAAFLRDARDYETHCSAVMDRAQRVRLHGWMGRALVHSKQYSEAMPILQLCAQEAIGMNGDYAFCWEELGEAAAHTGACAAALTGFRAALKVPTTDNLSSDSHQLAQLWLDALSRQGCAESTSAGGAKSSLPAGHLYGTAFFVSEGGFLLTNNHVVADCRSVTIGNGKSVTIVARDQGNDLALLKGSDPPPEVVRFRSGKPVMVGESVIAFGFPLPGTLSSSGVATSGIVSSLRGIQDDPRTLQFSAAIQPGNSGGPLLDAGGLVVGVVEAKLDSIKVADAIGVIPENVSFAINEAQIKAFLEESKVAPMFEDSKEVFSGSDIADFASLVTVSIDCER